MKQVRHVLSPLALVALTFASTAWACDKDHNTSAAAVGASSKSHACSAEMMAACQSTGAASAAAVHCPGMMGVALNLDASAQPLSSKADCCVSKSAATSAVNAEHSAGCSSKGASATTAVNTGRSRTMLAGAGGQCSGHMSSSSTAARMQHADCDACADMADCEAELQGSGTRVQMVPLKNGMMLVYTASSPGKVSALQSSLARRTERLNQLVSAGDKAHLCAECKAMRGAMASGKLNREVVNIEGGALTLMTSNDPAMVSKIYAMLDVNSKMVRKS